MQTCYFNNTYFALSQTFAEGLTKINQEKDSPAIQ